MEAHHRSVVFEGKTIDFTLEQKEVKNLNLRVHKDGNVFVSADPLVPLEEVDAFVHRKGAFILSAHRDFSRMALYMPRPKRYISGESFAYLGHELRLKVEMGKTNVVTSDGVFLLLRVKDPSDTEQKRRIVTRFMEEQCRRVFSEILSELYPRFQKYGVPSPKLSIRSMETRWGSCSYQRGLITLNKRLIEVPRSCIEYVVTHELCHFIHPNHSKHFYDFLTMMMPDWKERKEILNKQYAL